MPSGIFPNIILWNRVRHVRMIFALGISRVMEAKTWFLGG
jgi:hypothetical protein